MQRMYPVDCLVEIEGVPSQLVGDLVDLLERLVLWIRVVCGRLPWFEVLVRGSRKDAI